MSPGPAEEAGKVAGGVVEGLKSQPMVLALVVFMVLVLVAVVWVAREQQITEREMLRMLLALCTRTGGVAVP
jgi:hypothetical protein